MKIALVIIRTLVGLMFLFASLVYFFDLVKAPEMAGRAKTFNEGLAASVYIVPVIKTVELVCSLAFLIGRFVPLAVVLIFPIALNILLVHMFVMPEGLPVAVVLFAGILFLAFAHREKYQPLLAVR